MWRSRCCRRNSRAIGIGCHGSNAGPIPVREALELAIQIAEALECAHERGIVHRDLKPANIKVSESGSVKVLDFGLAKALATEVTASDTFTSPAMTPFGVILGTAAYMAPEQAKGKPVDRRADVWAFGGVLFEMLTGKRAFEGEDVTDVIASIMRAEPEWNALPADTPPAVRKLLKRCLEKDRAKRLDSMAVARYEIHEALASPVTSADEPRPLPRRSALQLIATGAACAVIAAIATWVTTRPRDAEVPLVRGSVTPITPDALSLDTFLSDVDISPDRTTIAFNGQRQGESTPRFVVESPIVVLENVFLPGPGRPYDVSPDGQKFIVVNETRVEQTAGQPLQLNFALNWLEDVKRRARGGTNR